jgi:hypothetical protein
VSRASSDNYRYTDEPLTESAMSGAREIPAWLVSLGVHVAVLFVLSGFTYVTGQLEEDDVITSIVDEYDEREYKFDVTVSDMVGNDSEVNTLSASQAAAKVVNQTTPQDQVQQELQEDILVPEAPPVNDIAQPPVADLASVIETTGATEKTGGVEGSLDRMTFEIMNSLRDRETLVVWLIDESGSLAKRRSDIADRFENIYGQLDSLNATAGLKKGRTAPLQTAIVGFGKGLNFYTDEPITDIGKAAGLIRSIQNDESGEEKVFYAVGSVVQKWRRFRSASNRHNCMIVIVTDERGDDFAAIEDVAALTSKLGFRVYCIGNSSPFGREKGFVRYTYPDDYSVDIPVDQGPESPRMEVLDLPYWGGRRVDSGRISSGLGPYALTRLCAETGGLYLITDDAAGRTFDSTIMKDYLPDYRPIRFYDDDVTKNQAKRALVAAAELTRRNRLIAPQLRFRADTDNALRTEATDAQRPASTLEYRVAEIVRELERGANDRARIREPRWQAAYDLAVGRANAVLARSLGYNQMLANMKVSPKSFENKKNNTWIMKPSGKVETGPAVKKIMARAVEHLSRVIEEHPGTPFEYLASRELEQRMGWTWEEAYLNYAEMGQGAGNNAAQNRVLFLEVTDPTTGKKKKIKRVPPKF